MVSVKINCPFCDYHKATLSTETKGNYPDEEIEYEYYTCQNCSDSWEVGEYEEHEETKNTKMVKPFNKDELFQ